MASPPTPSLPDWHTNPPDAPLLREWLLSEGSLTRQLKLLSNECFHVQPVQQGWQVLRDDECHALGEPLGTPGWVREVLLCGQQQAWVYARSVASRTALQHSGFDLARLGSRSLGELLFSDQAFVRSTFQLCNLPASAWPTALRQQDCGSAPLWTRRSCFTRNDLKILVAEAFLPAFWQRLARSTPVPASD